MFEVFLGQLLAVWELVKSLSPEASVLAVEVFVAVFLLRLVGVLKNGAWARTANMVLSSILAGVNAQLTPETATMFALVSIFSGTVFEVLSRFFGMFTVKTE